MTQVVATVPWFERHQMRDHACSNLGVKQLGRAVLVCGWVQKVRDLGGLYFIDLRDKSGLLQLNLTELLKEKPEIKAILDQMTLESVVQARGTIQRRPPGATNPEMATGEIEVEVLALQILSQAQRLPFLPHGHQETTEDLRLKYRYLDLRQKRLQDILSLRSQKAFEIRSFLIDQGFTEVETPVLYKTTPEGARDYLVPSRVHPGKFYALPQSPQTLKQLLMIGGTERYFQICKCFRDEDLRADRQPEFTQVDIEVSFGSSEFMKELSESLLQKLFQLPATFQLPIMTYQQAMDDYGCDKPDTRYGIPLIDLRRPLGRCSLPIFQHLAQLTGSGLKGLFLAPHLNVTRKQLDEWTEALKKLGLSGLGHVKVASDGTMSGSLAKVLTAELIDEMSVAHTDTMKRLGLSAQWESPQGTEGTWLILCHEKASLVAEGLDWLRRSLIKLLKPHCYSELALLWVKDFPLYEYDEKQQRLFACHHPFTRPKDEDLRFFFSDQLADQLKVRAEAYDLVCNGYEIAGGSQRIFDPQVQSRMFQLLGLSQDECQQKFGFFLEALSYGTPPHGGMAFGFDRLMMIIAQTENIRDVMAFPKTTSAMDLMAQAPSVAAPEQLKELGISIAVNRS